MNSRRRRFCSDLSAGRKHSAFNRYYQQQLYFKPRASMRRIINWVITHDLFRQAGFQFLFVCCSKYLSQILSADNPSTCWKLQRCYGSTAQKQLFCFLYHASRSHNNCIISLIQRHDFPLDHRLFAAWFIRVEPVAGNTGICILQLANFIISIYTLIPSGRLFCFNNPEQ